MGAIKCRLCEQEFLVSEADPDATVDDAVRHVAQLHGRDPLLDQDILIVLEDV